MIPRSGGEGEKVNCYIVGLYRDGLPYFLAYNYEQQKLNGLRWNDNSKSYIDNHTLEISDLYNGELKIIHHYGLSTITFNNIYDITWHYITKWIYIKINFYRYINSINQFFFNKRKFVTKKRMELLQFMIDDQLDRTHNGISLLDLMTKLYSINWVSHPSGDDEEIKLEFYLESLVESGDLVKINYEYVVKANALSTIEKYEEDERRHTEAVKHQRNLTWLTLVLAIMTAIQAFK